MTEFRPSLEKAPKSASALSRLSLILVSLRSLDRASPRSLEEVDTFCSSLLYPLVMLLASSAVGLFAGGIF